jgi:hypothetical protein
MPKFKVGDQVTISPEATMERCQRKKRNNQECPHSAIYTTD